MNVLEIKQVYKHNNHNKGKVCTYRSGVKVDKTRTDERKDYDRRMTKERTAKEVGDHFSTPPGPCF